MLKYEVPLGGGGGWWKLLACAPGPTAVLPLPDMLVL